MVKNLKGVTVTTAKDIELNNLQELFNELEPYLSNAQVHATSERFKDGGRIIVATIVVPGDKETNELPKYVSPGV